MCNARRGMMPAYSRLDEIAHIVGQQKVHKRGRRITTRTCVHYPRYANETRQFLALYLKAGNKMQMNMSAPHLQHKSTWPQTHKLKPGHDNRQLIPSKCILASLNTIQVAMTLS
jgi:hypothetical protein